MSYPLAWLTAVLIVAVAGCAGSSMPARTVTGTVVAAPTCPVEPAPGSSPEPACSPAPIAEVVLVFKDNGDEVATATTDAAGRYTLELPPGTYRVEPQPLAGFPATPDPIDFTVPADGSTTVDTVVYDTGIR